VTLRRWALYLLAAVALLLLGGRFIAAIYVDYRWYAAAGAAALWHEKAFGIMVTRGGSALAAAFFLFLNLFAVRQSVVSLVLPRRVGNIEIGEEVPGRRMLLVGAGIALLIGAFLTLPADAWIALSRVRHGLPFGERDPYFENDFAFWLYWLPFEQAVFLWALVTALAGAVVVIFLYALTPSLRFQRGSLYVSNYVRRHLTVLAALLLVLLAWNYRLDAFGLLLSGSGAEGAFAYIDHRARLNANIWLALITLVAALVTAWFAWSGQLRLALFTVGGVLVLSLGLRTILPAAMQRLAVVHDSEARERPYVAIRAGFTRRAFALERVERGSTDLAFESASEAALATSVWDPAALALTATRARAISPAIGWLPTEGGLVAIVPHPATPGQAGGRAEAWALVRTSAIAADARGEPIVVGADGRPHSRETRLAPVISHPGATGYLIVEDTLARIAAPELQTFGSRLAHAWSMQNVPLLFAELPRAGPRIVIRRGVRERVRALAPVLTPGSVVWPIVAADTLYWLVDLYSTSRTYPLSDRTLLDDREYRYAQRAATAIVNGSTGRVFLVADPAVDPMTRGYMNAFPELFTSWNRIPESLIRAVPPAVDETRLHAAMIARYGFRGEMLRRGWPAATESADTLLDRGAPPLFMLPDSRVLGASHAVLDARGNVAGVVVGTGGAHRASHWLPLESEGPRWSTMLDLLQRAVDTIPEFPRDARGVRGRLRVLPTPDEPLIVQPTYAWRPDHPPVLARVAVMAGGRVRLGTSLAAALGVPDPDVASDSEPLAPAEFRRRVAAIHGAMRLAMQRGDWQAFGIAYEELGVLLQRPMP
jgi:uncharacterized protein